MSFPIVPRFFYFSVLNVERIGFRFLEECELIIMRVYISNGNTLLVLLINPFT